MAIERKKVKNVCCLFDVAISGFIHFFYIRICRLIFSTAKVKAFLSFRFCITNMAINVGINAGDGLY